MKKFISRLMVFFVMIAIITLSINILFIKLDKGDPYYTNKFSNIPQKINVCNFGSSHGLYGFNYEDVESNGYVCFNFALDSQRLSYDYRLILQYGNHIDDGTVVFIPVSYFSLFGKDEEAGDNFVSKNKRYYTILPPDLIKDYDFQTNIYMNYLPAFTVDTFVLVKTLIGKGPTADDNDYVWMKAASDIDVSANAKSAYSRHIKKNKFDDNGNRILNQQELDALYLLIGFCREKGAIPILVTTPYLAEYTEEIKRSSPDFFDDFYAVLNNVIEDTGVNYYDYAFDERFVHNYEWFMNADHLNKEGARQFTNILMEEVANR